MEQFFRFTFLMVGFVLILIAAHFTARRMGGKIGHCGPRKYFNIFDRLSLGNECFIYMIRISGNVYIVGVTKTNIQVLDKFKENELEVLPQADVPNSFTEVLSKYFKKRTHSFNEERYEEHDQG